MIRAALASANQRPQLRAMPPAREESSWFDDVIILEVLLQLLDIVNLHHHAQAFADEHEEGVDQGLCGLAADVGFLPFVVLLHIFVGQALDLTFGGNVVARCYKTR